MPGIVAQQPTCRHCGSPVRWLARCPNCGKRRLWPTWSGGGMTRRY